MIKFSLLWSDHRILRFLFLIVLAGCSSTPVIVTEPPAKLVPIPVPIPKPQVNYRPQLDPITITAVGDIMLGTDFPDNRLPDDDGVGYLSQVQSLLQAADVTFGNLEGALMDGGEPVKKCNDPSLCFLFRTPTRYAQYLKDAGFDVLSLANNHARDFGEEGRTSSMNALDAVGIYHSGHETDIASWVIKGYRVALIAFAPHPESHSLLDIDYATEVVRATDEEHDLVIVSFHGGAEGVDALHLTFGAEFFYEQPRGDLVLFSRSVIDAGADLVVGHGPHVVRALEVYKERLIAYSLGNFATYYGISVSGLKGIAPILTVTLNQDGVFMRGNIVSTQQIRPNGPFVDPKNQAITLMEQLSREDLGEKSPVFDLDTGTIQPRP